MGMIDRLANWIGLPPATAVRQRPLPFDEWVSYFTFNNFDYPFRQTLIGDAQQPVSGEFTGFDAIYKSNGIVFACMQARQSLFSEASFKFQRVRNGELGDFFTNRDLAPLQTPWINGTTSDLLSLAISYADLAGNFFAVRRGTRIGILRPDWVTLIIGSRSRTDSVLDVDAEVVGYVYHPGGQGSGREPEIYLPEVVAHFMPIPDPTFRFRGMTWMTPVIREIQGDSAATSHKLRFFENAATPNMVVKLDIGDIDKFNAWVEKFNAGHAGVGNAYKTLFLGAGADVTPVGLNFQEMEFKALQNVTETRIASASGIHPTVLGFSEGLQGSSLNQGNFRSARRLTADKTLRPLWRNFSNSMASIIDVPPDARLWYDERQISFLQEEVKDAAEVQAQHMRTIAEGIRSGYDPDGLIELVLSGDFRVLKGLHSGFTSVQMQNLKPKANGAGDEETNDAVVSQEG